MPGFVRDPWPISLLIPAATLQRRHVYLYRTHQRPEAREAESLSRLTGCSQWAGEALFHVLHAASHLVRGLTHIPAHQI